MTGVDQNGVKAAVHQIRSRLSPFLLKRLHGLPGDLMAGGPAHDGAAVGDGITLGENADKLHGDLGPVEVHPLHQLHELVPVVGLVHVPCGVLAVIGHVLAHLETGHGDHAHTGSGPGLKEGDGILGGIQLPVAEGVHGGGCGDDAVFQQHAPDADRLKYLWNFVHIYIPPYRLGSMRIFSMPLRS